MGAGPPWCRRAGSQVKRYARGAVRGKEHRFTHAVKLVYVSGVLTVDKNRRAGRSGGYFQFAGGVPGRHPGRFHQGDVDLMGLPRLQDDLLDKLVVPGVTNDNFVLAGQEH